MAMTLLGENNRNWRLNAVDAVKPPDQYA